MIGSPAALVAFDSVHVASLLALLAGSLVHCGRQVRPAALVAVWALAGLWSAIAVFGLADATVLRHLTLAALTGTVAVIAGGILIGEEPRASAGRIAGFVLIAWGAQRFVHPLTREIDWLAPWEVMVSHGLMLALAVALILSVTRGMLRRAERRADEAKEDHSRMLRVIEASPVPMVIARLPDGLVYFMNQRANEVFAANPKPIADLPITEFFVDAGEYRNIVDGLADNDSVHDLELPLKARTGTTFWARTAWRRVTFGDEPVVLATISDITERKQTEDELRRLVTIDALTGVLNRHHLLELSKQEFARARRYSRGVSLILIDFDNVQIIKDSCGRASGDKALRELATACRRRLRAHDLFGRLGGDGFAAVLPETGREAASKVAERLLDALSGIEDLMPDPDVPVSLSVGVTDVREADESLQSALERADSALYMAKQSGRNCVVAK